METTRKFQKKGKKGESTESTIRARRAGGIHAVRNISIGRCAGKPKKDKKV